MKVLTIYGHLGSDAQVKNANGAEYLQLSVAVNEKKAGKESTVWITVFTRQMNLAPFLTKGTAVVATGRAEWNIYYVQAEPRMGCSISAHYIQLAGKPREDASGPVAAIVPELPASEL